MKWRYNVCFVSSIANQWNRDITVSRVTRVRAGDRGSISGRCSGGIFSLRHHVQTGSGAHPASYPAGTRGFFPAMKRPGRETDHSPPSSTEVKNAW
jgi:hypothetical protein